MIDLMSESLLTFSQATKYLPGNPHISTIHRWRLRGVRGHKLESILVGGRRFTSRQALERFAAKTTAAADGEQPPISSPRQQRRAYETADRELREAGI